jgi:hypothetical protein
MDIQTEEEVDIFRNDVKTFQKIEIEIDKLKKQMKPMRARLKELNIQKNDLQSEICLTLSKNNMNQVQLQDTGFKIEYVQKQAVVPINQSSVKEKISYFFEKGIGSKLSFNSLTGAQKANSLIDFLYAKENRQYIQKDVLKQI